MGQVIQLVAFSSLVAFSIFLTYPITFKRLSWKWYRFLIGLALGILVYLLMDVFSGTYPLLQG
ncbi:MAG: hypothetical protein MPF33_06400 [Candidatus Aramenus sp.]|jgi:ZIP family zinc transporter|nr:hypothetical protein [Candidatus Aramenus sp.]